ncbi:MAG TPA: transcriptional regulator [Rudaea sp.]|nr:transcriptional regulator [Rudaea sp.]
MSKRYTLNPIRTEADYEAALTQAGRYFDAEPNPNSAEGAHFDALITLIEAWETKHHPVLPADPVEAIKFRMEQAGLTARDLTTAIGGMNRVYEVLNRKRGLSLAMIRKLHDQFGMPLNALVGVDVTQARTA